MKKTIGFTLLAFALVSVPVLYSSIPHEKAKAMKPKSTTENISFLTDMGFTNSKTVKENADLVDIGLRKEYAKKVGLKFFTQRSLTAIMKSQGLVLGSISDYTGEIPEANINEFKANYERLKPAPEYTHYYVMDRRDATIAWVSESNIEDKWKPVLSGSGLGLGVPWTGSVLKDPSDFADVPVSTTGYSKQARLTTDKPLKIAAPQKYFNMEGKFIDELGNLLTKPVDPMILMPYENGWIVLTQWY